MTVFVHALPRALLIFGIIGTAMFAGCSEREDVVGPRTDGRNRELTASDCGYIYTVTVTPDTVAAPGLGGAPEIVEFLVDIEEDGCYQPGPIEDVWVSFFPADSGAPTGMFITDSLPAGRWHFLDQEGPPDWVLTVYSDANGVVRVPFLTSGVPGENRIEVFPHRIDWTTGPITTVSVVTEDALCPDDPWFQDPAFRDLLRELWEDSNPTVPEVGGGDARERGGFIREDSGTYSIEEVPLGSDECHLVWPLIPPGDAVGTVHTHPFKSGEYEGICGDSPGTVRRIGSDMLSDHDDRAARYFNDEFGMEPHYVLYENGGVIEFKPEMTILEHYAACLQDN